MRYVHEVWEDPEYGLVTFLCYAWPWAEQYRRVLSPRAKVIGTFEAGSMLEAAILFNRFMGWEERNPTEPDFDDTPYPDEWGRQRHGSN